MVEMLRNAQQEPRHAITPAKTDLNDGDVFLKLQNVLNPLKGSNQYL